MLQFPWFCEGDSWFVQISLQKQCFLTHMNAETFSFQKNKKLLSKQKRFEKCFENMKITKIQSLVKMVLCTGKSFSKRGHNWFSFFSSFSILRR